MRRATVVIAFCALGAVAWSLLTRQGEALSAEQFWQLYFDDRLLTLRRDQDSYVGLARANSPTVSPTALLIERDAVSFRVSMPTLRAYSYLTDDRFSRYEASPLGVADAFSGVIEGRYSIRDTAPFSSQRIRELLSAIRVQHILPGDDARLLERLESLVSQLVATRSENANQDIAALAWFLGEQRHRSSAKSLLEVVRQSSYLHGDASTIHAVSVDMAFTALAKINDKTLLSEMLEVMRLANESGRRRIAALFSRLLSTRELLSIELLEERWTDPEWWTATFEPLRSNTTADWDRFDSTSLFWELRYFSAKTMPRSEPSLQVLAADEVAVVRRVAQTRLR